MSHLPCPTIREARIKTEANNVPKRKKAPLDKSIVTDLRI